MNLNNQSKNNNLLDFNQSNNQNKEQNQEQSIFYDPDQYSININKKLKPIIETTTQNNQDVKVKLNYTQEWDKDFCEHVQFKGYFLYHMSLNSALTFVDKTSCEFLPLGNFTTHKSFDQKKLHDLKERIKVLIVSIRKQKKPSDALSFSDFETIFHLVLKFAIDFELKAYFVAAFPKF